MKSGWEFVNSVNGGGKLDSVGLVAKNAVVLLGN